VPITIDQPRETVEDVAASIPEPQPDEQAATTAVGSGAQKKVPARAKR
jgi:hypothetical protein